MDVPVQYFQSVIAIELAITGGLLYQVRFFSPDRPGDGHRPADARLRLLVAVILFATLFGALAGIRVGGGQLHAALVAVGLVLSSLPIVLRVMPPLTDRGGRPREPHTWVTVLALVLLVVMVLFLVLVD
jgi:hypothetical protein